MAYLKPFLLVQGTPFTASTIVEGLDATREKDRAIIDSLGFVINEDGTVHRKSGGDGHRRFSESEFPPVFETNMYPTQVLSLMDNWGYQMISSCTVINSSNAILWTLEEK